MLVLWGGILPRANPTRMGDLLGSFHQGRPKQIREFLDGQPMGGKVDNIGGAKAGCYIHRQSCVYE
ncbi:hypothetical protein HanPSC8_Chr02g0046531 [Helianthus annuus]|nr:hypothetical protein HanPSC8_Chr02g0046531 [Helianthus annuus]